ncbi:MAG: RNA polymerase sigma-54 factor [Acidobacteria bacterium]|nr:MAG: RNA polymerase sigma-54 factor [Acidobacteriota bacterium]REK10383.1 MAG: RNA polymerase sigma-54 factor [Acidobacteriota bacterium]
MALEQKLSLKLSQRLVMTPSLQQAIKLLQMTRLELEGVITEELTENPMLEQMEDLEDDEKGVDQEPEAADGGSDEGPDSEAQAGEDDARSDDAADRTDGQQEREADEPAAEADDKEQESEDLESLDDIDIDAYFNDYLDGAGSTAASTFELREAAPLENTISAGPELSDHLLWQIRMMDLEPLDRELAEVVIGNLNEDGFLRASVEEIQLLAASDEERSEYERRLEAHRRWLRAHEAGAGKDDERREEPRDGGDSTPDPEDASLEELERRSEAAVPQAQRVASVASSGLRAQSVASSRVDSADSVEAVDAGAGVAVLEDEAGREPVGAAGAPDPASADPSQRPEVPGYPRAAVESAIELIQALDPPGIGAVDLRQSLLLQLRAAGEDETLAYELIEQDWDRLLKRQFAAIAKSMGRPLADLEEPFERIKRLDTRPGRRFGGSGPQYVEPDVAVVKVGGEYVIQINDDGMPRLRVSKAYRRMLQKMRAEGRESDAQQYLREKMRSAIWLIKSLDQRQRTIYKVANSIVKQQRGFLDGGIEHLRPMVLRDVAEDIGMHESTVSRVVSNKYIHTPRGLYPMKFFFHSGIDSDQGEDVSSLSVKRKLKHFIEGENPKKPLSDSALMRRLNAEGINIARRTVAKYRDELNIPSSTDRKQVF